MSKSWPPLMRAELIRLRAEGRTRDEIAAILGVSFYAVKYAVKTAAPRYHKAPHPRERDDYVLPGRAPKSVLAERDQRISAPYRDLTAAFFGDPPAGYSALDRQ